MGELLSQISIDEASAVPAGFVAGGIRNIEGDIAEATVQNETKEAEEKAKVDAVKRRSLTAKWAAKAAARAKQRGKGEYR